jgi:2-acylglycerol O-acyltransferase 2
MATVTIPLKAETSQPQERAEHNLPPKSYADAVANTTRETSGRADADEANTSGAIGYLENHSGHTVGNVNGFPPVKNDITTQISPEQSGEDKAHEKTTGRQKVGKDKVIYEKYVNDRGDRLTSVKPDESYEKSLEHDRETAPREKKKVRSMEASKKHDEKPHLASGRRAGAGWERSA